MSRAWLQALRWIGLPGLLALSGPAGSEPGSPVPHGAEPRAHGDVVRDGALVQITRAMTLDLSAPADRVFPLFGPVREAEWSPDWAPEFVAPWPGRQSADGAVFTTGPAATPTVWVMTDYDTEHRIVRYVHLRPGGVVAQLRIDVAPASPHSSHAHVSFRLTALGEQGRDALEHFDASFPHMKPHWEQAVSAALGRGGAPAHAHP